MANEQVVNLEVRLAALEYVLAQVAKVAIAAGVGPDLVLVGARKMREAARHQLEQQTFSGLSPALSDHVAAELQGEVDRILADVEEIAAGALRSIANRQAP
jgi:hypothetical protein